MTHDIKNKLPEIGKWVMLYYKYKYDDKIYTDWTRAKLEVKNDLELVWYNFYNEEIKFRENRWTPYKWIGD